MSRIPPPAWMKPGALADFHAFVNGPVSHASRRVISEPRQLGSGDWVVKLDGISGCVSVDAVTPAGTAEANRLDVCWPP